MATVIIGGLIFASILTLVLTPSILMIEARVVDWFAARRAGASLAATGVSPLVAETLLKGNPSRG
jgi:hypothetical protein